MISLREFKDRLKAEGSVDWPVDPRLEFFWCFRMKADQQGLWMHLSDTSRFNRELGLAPRTETEKDGQIHVTTTVIGFPQAWVEEPWTWVAGRTMASTRTYSKGMAKKVHAVFHIDAQSDPNERLVYIYFGWTAASTFWHSFLKLTGPLLRGNFEKTFAKIDSNLTRPTGISESALIKTPRPLAESSKRHLEEAKVILLGKGIQPDAVEHLCEFIEKGDDLELEAIRVIPLAKKWKVDVQELLSACLHASRISLLRISWKVICPHCRGSRFAAGNLGDIPETSACTVCDIDFETDTEDSIEVIFHVHPSVRVVEELLYCASEPAKKSHIKIQHLVRGSSTVTLPMPERAGMYRGRFIGNDTVYKIEVGPDMAPDLLDLEGAATEDVIKAGYPLRIRIANPDPAPALFVLEELWWQATALKPSHVFSMPAFRDLFAEEHLSANVRLSLGEQTILFTDIVGSTRFYGELGDAKAFAQIRAHFQELFQEVRDHGGVVVKTIGDSIMASFRSPPDAVEAALKMQKRFSAGREQSSIRLRIAIHAGPVIAVHLNTGIDYFGHTVNAAAKIQSYANAGEIAMSPLVEEAFRTSSAGEERWPVSTHRWVGDTRNALEISVVHVGAREVVELKTRSAL